MRFSETTIAVGRPALRLGGPGGIGNSSNAPGAFNDTFSFTTLVGSASGTISSSFQATKNATFTSVTLDGVGYTPIVTGPVDFFNLNPTALLAGTHVIQVVGSWVGSKGGSYGGSLDFTVSAAPEPATWGMIIVGFGIAGAALRRRRADVRVAYA